MIRVNWTANISRRWESSCIISTSAKAQWFAHGDVGQEVRENRASEAEPKMLQCNLWYILVQTPNKCFNTSLPAHGSWLELVRKAETLKVLMGTLNVLPYQSCFFWIYFAGRTKRSDVLFGTNAWMTPQVIIDEPSKSSRETMSLITSGH